MGTTNVQSGFNANDLYIDKTNHRIGMGTGSPEKELHVNGDIMFPNNKAIYSKDLAGTVVKIIEFTSGDVLNFGTAATVDGFIFNAGGTANALVIDSSGDVGIGTDSPSAKLEIHNDDDANQNTLDCYNDNGYITFSVDPKSDGTGRLRLFDGTGGVTNVFEVDAGGKMYFTGGNVGIGTDSPSSLLHTKDASGGHNLEMESDSLSNDERVRVYIHGNDGGSERYAEIGIYNHSGISDPCGYIRYMATDGNSSYSWTDDTDELRISTTVTHIGTTSGTVVGDQTSDERLKNIVGNCDYGLDEILALDTIAFNFKGDKTAEKHIGFSAQKTREIIPEAVYSTGEEIDDSENPKLAMRYHEIIPVLVNAIKEQQKQINELKEMIK